MTTRERFLLVGVGGRVFGLTIDALVEVVDLPATFPVPALTTAMRGVMPVRDSMVPVFHLGAALAGGPCPPEAGSMAVVAEVDSGRLCFEVDRAEEVVFEDVQPLSGDHDVPGTIGVAQHADQYIPIIDVRVLSAHILQSGMTP